MGGYIRGTVVKYFEDGDVLLKRTSDLQLFRIKLDIFTEDDQAFVKNNFPPNHDALPKFKKPLDQRTLRTFSDSIDQKIDRRLKSYRQRPNKEVTDEAFLRRAYLKIIGRIPTVAETEQFMSNRNSSARGKLIDQLLASKGYTHNWFIYWADILRATGRVIEDLMGFLLLGTFNNQFRKISPTTFSSMICLRQPALYGAEVMVPLVTFTATLVWD